MPWNILDNLADGDDVLETHMDDIRENIEHLGAITVNGDPLSILSRITLSGVKFAYGNYTGNGSATRAITGLGFQPTVLIVSPRIGVNLFIKDANDGANTSFTHSGQWYTTDMIISLDADGFTVGDGTGFGDGNRLNINSTVYRYIAFG